MGARSGPGERAERDVDVAEGRDGRTADDVQLWLGHPCRLGPPGLEARLARQAMA